MNNVINLQVWKMVEAAEKVAAIMFNRPMDYTALKRDYEAVIALKAKSKPKD